MSVDANTWSAPFRACMALAGPQTVAYDTGQGAVSLTNVRYNGAILVGKTGKRFTNKLGSTAKIGADIKTQALRSSSSTARALRTPRS